ncbi:5-(carboxyamino)imidazole ribonucleotide synthase [Sediminibacillus albus]|uniref:N5-carboxyaminoimidazole ribonucleotide synthase n=1 Tax=Sediminibacillus albus TaxID=407036 RepID=A0A1G9BCA9_9BACI|nr:5-(carboxyamino)imidazole ribonucleotide synthase [Sediminibacillus albus]SDK37113.1 5-(carboxyamino)imidazole ribonucleotide synthase [Sediminibacillus albus]
MRPNRILPGKMIGILGGGQLGRMMATAARHMGYRIAVLDPTPDCPAAQVSDHHIVAAYDDLQAIKQLAEISDVVTYEFENVDLAAARYLEAEGVLPQGSELLKITQDREVEKSRLVDSSLPVPAFAIIYHHSELAEKAAEVGLPFVLKTCRGGYDGKGQMIAKTENDLAAAEQFVASNSRCIIERFIPFEKEISVVFTRSAAGEITYFPVAENQHKNHILHQTTVPADISANLENNAQAAAKTVAESLSVVGTFAIEMFVVGEEILINEMAPRPHNSGHFTIEACNVSQFEQHIRAVCGLPLVPVLFHGGAIMLNLLGAEMEEYVQAENEFTNGHLHIYGKQGIKPNRKMGHVTYVGSNIEETRKQFEKTHASDSSFSGASQPVW